MKEIIEWHSAESEKPDTDTTVLVGFESGECECGYFDSECGCWRNFSGARFDDSVASWANLPPAPGVETMRQAVACKLPPEDVVKPMLASFAADVARRAMAGQTIMGMHEADDFWEQRLGPLVAKETEAA